MTTEFSSALEMWHCTDTLASGRHQVDNDRMQSHTEWFGDAIKSSLERLGIDRRLLRTPMLYWSKGVSVEVVRQQWLERLRDSLVPIVFELGEVPANWQEFFPAKPIRDLPDFLGWLNDVSRQQGHDIHSAQCSLGNAHLWMFTHQIESRPEWPQAMPDTVLGCVSAIVRIIDAMKHESEATKADVSTDTQKKAGNISLTDPEVFALCKYLKKNLNRFTTQIECAREFCRENNYDEQEAENRMRSAYRHKPLWS